MSTLTLIRHGQASLGSEDYDRLSALGEEQGRQIGTYLGHLDRRFDRLFVGPRLRHRQTHEAAAQNAADLGAPFPEAQRIGSFDEHQCPEVLDFHREELERRFARPDDKGSVGSYLRIFRQGSLLWVRGELETPSDLEDWQTFKARIRSDLEEVRRRVTDPKAKVVIFTSGGAIAAAVGQALGLDDEKIIETSWSIRNGSITELHLSKRGFGLASFNTVPFTEPRLWTYV